MQIVMKSLSEVRPYDHNPRRNDGAVEAVANSIREYGFRQPIVVDADGVIVVGHTRWKAAQKLGMSEVPVHVARELTPEQARAYRIADNRTALIAEWDEDLLSSELAALKALDVDLSLLGFDDAELQNYLNPPTTVGLVDEDDVPEPPDEATTRPGDLWVLGQHRVLCADSSKPKDVDRLLDGAKINLVNSDPPYNVRVEPRSNTPSSRACRRSRSPRASPRATTTRTTSSRPTSTATPRSPSPRTASSAPRTGLWPTTS